MKRQLGNMLVEALTIAVVIAAAVAGVLGWIWNIVKLADATFDVITGLLVLRVLGVVVFPLGMVVGYL